MCPECAGENNRTIKKVNGVQIKVCLCCGYTWAVEEKEDWYSRQKSYIIKEAGKFQAPEGFAGGCKKSRMSGFCMHIKPDGTLGKIEENCPHYTQCKGQNFKYNI